MIKYAYSSFVDIYFSFYRSKTTKMLILKAQGSSLEHIRERLAEFIVTKVISRKGEFHFS
jgi:hypothetical protein